MQIKREASGERVTLSVAGEIEVYSLPQFTEQAEACLGGPQELVLDFNELDYIDSSGLGFLVTLHERLVNHGQQMQLINLRPHVARVFQITRLDRVLNIVDEEAPAT